MKRNGLFTLLFGKNRQNDEEEYRNLNFEEQDMIKGIVTLSETTVKEVMVPRIDVEFLSNEAPKSNILEALIEHGYSRYPVYKDTIDNVTGILYVKDMLPVFMRGEEIDIGTIARKPYFVPESKKLDTLLKEFRRRKVHIAVAVDEYGGVSGIVCLEDIIEEIVGDIQDEFDNEEEDILELGAGIYLCDARVDIEDLNEQIKLTLPESDFDTLGGFVFDLFGKIPVKYEKVTYDHLEFIVQEMDGHKIKTVKVINREKAHLAQH